MEPDGSGNYFGVNVIDGLKISWKMLKNKWSMAFWISLIILIAVTIYGFYMIIDQNVTIAYMIDGFTKTENDLNTLIELFNETDLTKSQVENRLRNHEFFEYMDFSKDTISLERVNLIFQKDTLRIIEKQW